MLRYLTAGESHGPGLAVILDGMPAGLRIDLKFINDELSQRQGGYGRGPRMKIETDRVQLWSGLKSGRTIGSPLTLIVPNKDSSLEGLPAVTTPRPGHADLAGMMKFGLLDARPVLERASARETAARVALGAVAQLFLKEFGVTIQSWVVSIGPVQVCSLSPAETERNLSRSVLSCPDPTAEKKMIRLIDRARSAGDTLGGIFLVKAVGVPPGLGGYSQPSDQLDARLTAALMSIPAIKAVEVGEGWRMAGTTGRKAHDEILPGKKDGFLRPTNRAGGIEGGMSNGQEIVLRAAMKPISTLGRPLRTVNLLTGKPAPASRERSDVCALPAAAVVGRAVVALELADVWLKKFAGDTVSEVRAAWKGYLKRMARISRVEAKG
jgi:chorismate synthase